MSPGESVEPVLTDYNSSVISLRHPKSANPPNENKIAISLFIDEGAPNGPDQ
jgi:hypothetical protein